MTPDQARDLLDGTTPGPWVRRRDADGNPTPVVVSAGPTDRHHIMTADPAAPPERQQADTALIAAAPTLAAMIAGMREEWGVSYRRDHENDKRTTWGWDTREDAERSMRLMTRVYVYGLVRRYVTNEEEIS